MEKMRELYKRLEYRDLISETSVRLGLSIRPSGLFVWMLWCLCLLLPAFLVKAEPSQSLAQTVVQIKGTDAGGRFYFGSGVLIDQEWVATNCHVVRQGGRVLVLRAGQGFKATHLKADPFKDLCLLKVPGIGSHGARLRTGVVPRPGSMVSYYGFPRALGMSYAEGRVTQVYPLMGGALIQTTAFFTLGGSGGGLFDAKGRLAGLATFLTPGHSGAYFVIPSTWVEGVRHKPEMPITPLTGKAFWEDAEGVAAFLKGQKVIKAPSP